MLRHSVFTPTHDPRWLPDTFRSLQQQAYKSFEWVVVTNGPLKAQDALQSLPGASSDPRVRVVEAPESVHGVGALKRYACSLCTGDIFVELDHDDQLTPDCLEIIDKAARVTPGGFYYSDFVSVKPDGQSETYVTSHGWEHYPWSFEGEDYTAMRAFSPSARSVSEVYYAPNHVRAWSREAYEKTGGYNADLAVGDDHDLVCRTYLAGVPFAYVPKVLYVYSSYPASTSHARSAEVSRQQLLNRDQYLYPLIYEECRRLGVPMLEVNTDTVRKGPGFEPFDLLAWRDDKGTLEELPYPDDKFGCVWLNDLLHKINRDSLYHLFNELHRILRPGGWLLTNTPALDDGEGRVGRGAFQDPSHESHWSPNTFWYFTHRDYARHIPGYHGRFQLVRSGTRYPSRWHQANQLPYVSADMVALKGQREAGLSTI